MNIEYDFFAKELSFIRDDKIRMLTTYAVKKINPNFFVEAASSTGKYHPEYSLGFAGTYRHTQAGVKIANDLLQLEMYQEAFSPTVRDYIIAALILHDSCKRGVDWSNKHTIHEHPILVEQFLVETLKSDNPDGPWYRFDDKEFIDEYINSVSNLVKSHMGQWNTVRWSGVELPKPELAPQKFVHLCDYLASRKWLEVKINQDDN